MGGGLALTVLVQVLWCKLQVCDASVCLGKIPLALLSFRQRAEVFLASMEGWLIIGVVGVLCA